MTDSTITHRRRFLRQCAGLAAVSAWPMTTARAQAGPAAERTLALVHLHTLEQIELVYAMNGAYVDDALALLNHFLRDHYSGDVGRIAPQVFDVLHGVQQALGNSGPIEIISGYRSPATNEHLRRTRGEGVAKTSLHMQGRAIDLRLPGVALADLRDAALSLRAGGVGFYPHEQFVHLDTGRVRSW
jgi:uncharacterized protein YcbK (DUF882 family)